MASISTARIERQAGHANGGHGHACAFARAVSANKVQTHYRLIPDAGRWKEGSEATNPLSLTNIARAHRDLRQVLHWFCARKC